MKTRDTYFPGLLHITSIHNDNSPLLEIIYGQNLPPYNALKEKKSPSQQYNNFQYALPWKVFFPPIVPVVAICLKAMTCQWNSNHFVYLLPSWLDSSYIIQTLLYI